MNNNLVSFLILGVAGFFLQKYLAEKFSAQAQTANLPGADPLRPSPANWNVPIAAPPGSEEARGGVWMTDYAGSGKYYFPGEWGYAAAREAAGDRFALN